jgi:hypothetical protein
MPELVKWAAIVITAVVVVLVTRLIVLNRRSARAVPLEPLPAAVQEADANPLSRDAGEWELYAERLAKTGRFREAVRAWYHAALVTLFRSGILHFRKGRTNWEYCYALPSSLRERDRFNELTRVFEAEWYGSDRSQPERVSACADMARSVMLAARAPGAGGGA